MCMYRMISTKRLLKKKSHYLGCWEASLSCRLQTWAFLTLIKGPHTSRDQYISPETLQSMITKWLIKTILSFNFKLSECLFIYLFKSIVKLSLAEISLKSNFRGKTQPYSETGKANQKGARRCESKRVAIKG